MNSTKILIKGTRGTGKSTAILNVMKDKLKYSGGFCTNLIYDEKKDIKYFCHSKSCNFQSAISGEIQEPSNVFLKVEKNFKTTLYKEVFEQFTFNTFLNIKKDFFLADEVGGLEIQLDEIYQGFLSTLANAKNLLGVVKHENNFEKLCKNYNNKEKLIQISKKFQHDLLNKAKVNIIDVSNYTYMEVESLILDWKKGIYKYDHQ